jgi:hypothetical protein
MGQFGVASYVVTMAPAARWLIVGVIVLGVVTPSLLLRALPASSSDATAATLAGKAVRSTGTSWSGEVSSQGSLDVPLDSSMFGGVARLLGDQNNLRVWWRDADTWRVDRLRTSGESDIARNGGLSVKWNYEEGRARFAAYTPIRLPDDNDVVPSSLAARLLDGARASELSRLPARRIAGASAAGVRLIPSDASSTIARVDVWVDESSGLPLRVEVYGDRDVHPVLTSEVTSFHVGDPSDSEVGFRLSPGVHAVRGETLDDLAAANAFAPFLLPTRVIGLERRAAPADLGAVGVYGRGPTALLAIPLRGGTADALHKQLARSHNARSTKDSAALEVGPLSVLLVQKEDSNFLLAGTITPASLRQAAVDLEAGTLRTFR